MARAAPLLAMLATLLTAAAAGGDAPPGKIAVIGAGIGGSAVAHFLQQHFGPRVQIVVYEKGTVGGRLATISVNKQNYESGAASFHSLSLHMQDFVKLLGLRQRREVVGRSAIFGGEHFVLEETDWYLLNLFRLWWYYGISFLRLQMWVEEVMEKFMRIYKYQAHGYAFSGVEELLYSLGEATFVNMTQRSVAESLLQVGVTQRFIDDVVSAVLRASYGQSASMPAFAGAMSLAGAQGNLWSVEGGNNLVCSGLLKLAKASVIHAGDLCDPAHYRAPSSPLCLLVHGYLNSSYFGFPDRSFSLSQHTHHRFPQLLLHSGQHLPCQHLSQLPVSSPKSGSVASAVPSLFRTELKTLFRSYYSVQTAEWQAHPSTAPATASRVRSRPALLPQRLGWAASSVEMMAVAAKNVALLAYNRWYQDLDKIDQKDLIHKVKTEL
ncbi:hypothetical protein STEG23_022920 [Scotinomys teguina]